MNILNFLIEARGFTYQGKLYASGGSKTEKKYFCDQEEITKAEYEKALAAHRAHPEKNQKKTPLITKKETPKEEPKVSVEKKTPSERKFVPDRISEIETYLKENEFIPSSKSGAEGRKENIERLSKMLRLPYEIKMDAVRDEGVLYMCNAVSRIAKDFPFILDKEAKGSLHFFGTNAGLIELVKELHSRPEVFKNTPQYKHSVALMEDSAKRKIDVINEIGRIYRENPFAENFPGYPDFMEDFLKRIPCNLSKSFFGEGADFYSGYMKIMDSYSWDTRDKQRKIYGNKLAAALKQFGFDVELKNDKQFQKEMMNGSLTQIMHCVFSKITENPKNASLLKKVFVSDESLELITKRMFDSMDFIRKDLWCSNNGGCCYYLKESGTRAVVMNQKYAGDEYPENFETYGYGNENFTGTSGFHNIELVGSEKRTGMNHIAIHELGHVINARLQYMMEGDSQVGFSEEIILEKPMKIGDKEYVAITPYPSMFFKTLFRNLGKETLEKEISGYAAKDEGEMISEAFANVYCTEHPSEISKQIVELTKICMRENLKSEFRKEHPEYEEELKKSEQNHDIVFQKEAEEYANNKLKYFGNSQKKYNESKKLKKDREKFDIICQNMVYELFTKEGLEKFKELNSNYTYSLNTSKDKKKVNVQYFKLLCKLLKDEGYDISSMNFEDMFGDGIKYDSFLVDIGLITNILNSNANIETYKKHVIDYNVERAKEKRR